MAAREPSMPERGVDAAAEVLRSGLRPFAAPPGQARTRRATDVVALVPAVAGLLVAIAVYPPSSFELALVRFLDAIPGWIDPVWEFTSDVLWLWAVALVLLALGWRRLLAVGQAALALLIAVLVGLAATRATVGEWPSVYDGIFGTKHAPEFPDVRATAAVAVALTISPHLVRPLRSLGRWIILLGLVGAAAVGTATPAGVVSALLIGVVAAATVNLVLGTSAGRPGIADIEAALAQLGVHAEGLEPEERQVAGVERVRAVDTHGRPLLIKVFGRDAADNQLVARIWRRAMYRSAGPAVGSSRQHAAEHEALVTLLARDAGIPTRDVVTAASSASDDAVLVLRGAAISIDEVEPDRLDPSLLGEVWSALARLDAAKIAHQQLDGDSVVLVDGAVGFVDFGGATVAPSEEQLVTDRAQLLVLTATLAGEAPAIAAAVGALGARGLAALLPYLQTAALRPALRRAVKSADLDVDDLRRRAADAAGVDPPDLVKLRRIAPWQIAQLALLALAAYTIVDAAEGVEWHEVWDSVSDASWEWLVAAFVVAQLPRVTQALATMGSVPSQLPFGPVYGMQLATGYMNVALPSNLARMAVNIRFFQRQGLSAPTAVASGAIDSFASTVVQAILLGALLLFSESSVELDLPFPSGGSETLLWIVAGIAGIAIVALVAIRSIRRAISDRVRQWWPDVRDTLAALRTSHKLALLALGSLATEVLFAVALGLFAQGFGYDISLAELLLINVGVALIGTLVPIPGNVGVAEFGLTVGLTSAGMSPEAAVAAVLLYRISTYYLPPLWGFFALRWLQQNRYL
ncbi:MAG TPA: lysylphosphatidylglycerol synthase domain-containing protein [Gaiellaceae bacterium]|nr:lysylphosphatidylglycerol synthase domain-containing protein [Gaiellaceae bacterium]